MPTSSAEKPYSQSSDGKSNKTRGVEFEKSTGRVEYITSRAAASGAESSAFNVHDFKSETNSLKAKFDDDNDDFRVPTLAQSEVASHSKDAPLVEVNKLASFGATNVQNSTNLDSSVHVLSSSSEPIHEANASGKLSRKRERMHSEQECAGTISSKDHGDKFPNYPEAGEVLAGPSKNSLAPADRGTEINMVSLDKTSHQRTRICNEASYDGSVENRNAFKMQRQSCSRASFEYSQRNYDDKANGSGELKNAERSGEVSEVSIIDTISVLDICPDDVVGVIGPKQFWKARRAIVK